MAGRRWPRDPLWWLFSTLPIVAFAILWQRAAPSGPVTLGGVIGAVALALAYAAIVAVVIAAARDTGRLVRRGPGPAGARAERKARSSGVAEALVGGATLAVLAVIVVAAIVLTVR